MKWVWNLNGLADLVFVINYWLIECEKKKQHLSDVVWVYSWEIAAIKISTPKNKFNDNTRMRL